MAGAAFGDVAGPLFVAGAEIGGVAASLFVAGAAFGEIWVDSRSAKCCNFQYKMRLRTAKSNLGERAGARTSSCSDHGRIMVESAAHCKLLTVFGKFLLDLGVLGVQLCVAGAVFGEVGGCCLLLRAL